MVFDTASHVQRRVTVVALTDTLWVLLQEAQPRHDSLTRRHVKQGGWRFAHTRIAQELSATGTSSEKLKTVNPTLEYSSNDHTKSSCTTSAGLNKCSNCVHQLEFHHALSGRSV